jgi:glutamyl-tRNA synthetase/glutamyl-Q tRNA(Asp) synthetase
MITRFAPSTTGHAHPGTLLSALLTWLSARSTGGRVVLRLENLDPQRCRPEFDLAMIDELRWFGLDWDDIVHQDRRTADHEAALDSLAKSGRLYPCSCSRARLKELGRAAPDGGFAYDNRCRHQPLPVSGWRACTEPLRVCLSDDAILFTDEGGLIIQQSPARDMGDPVVRRRDGAIAYHLACVIDDAAMHATHLIRGRDLAPSAPVQIVLQRLLELPTPTYRHHFLLLEKTGSKLAKFHQSVAVTELKRTYSAEALCGWLAFVAGLRSAPDPAHPEDLITSFTWSRVNTNDVGVSWNGSNLTAHA